MTSSLIRMFQYGKIINLVLLAILSNVPIYAESLSSLHDRYLEQLGASASKPSDFLKLAQQYANAIKSKNINSAMAHYNTGTLFLKAESYGKALAHLHQAYAIAPNDQRIADHLQRAHLQAGLEMNHDRPQNLITWMKTFWKQTELLHWQILTLLFSCSALVLSFSPIQVSKGVSSCLILGTLMGGLFSFLHHRQIGMDRSIVLIEDLNPHSGLGPQYPGILKKGHVLPAGSSGTILREQSGWKEIAFSQDQRGWIPKASAQEIYKY